MGSHEDEAGELIWKYIEEIRAADDPATINFVARTPADLNEYAALLPLADVLDATLRDEATGSGQEDEPPAVLLAAIQSSQAQHIALSRQRDRRFLWRGRWAVWGLAAAAAMFTFLIWRSVPHAFLPTVTLRVQSMIRDHEEFVLDPAKVAVKGDDPIRVAAALSPQFGYAVMPVDLSLAGAKLLGGRRCMLDGAVVAFFMYHVGDLPVSVYELRAAHCRLPGLAEQVVAGRRYLNGTDGKYNVLAWRTGDRLYVMVSVLQTEKLTEMAQHLNGSATNGQAGDTL